MRDVNPGRLLKKTGVSGFLRSGQPRWRIFAQPDQPKVAFEGLAVLPRRMADQTGRAPLPGPFPDDQTGHPSADPQGSAAGEHLRDDSAGALSLLASPQP